jgi:hypothetical protein
MEEKIEELLHANHLEYDQKTKPKNSLGRRTNLQQTKVIKKNLFNEIIAENF